MDKISLSAIKVNCIVGVNAIEKLKKQELLIDVDLYLPINKAAVSDNINDTINYSKVFFLLKKRIEKNKYNLIETIAQQSAVFLLKEYPILDKVTITVYKKPKDLLQELNYVSVQITKEKE